MCGRYNFSNDTDDEKISALVSMMNKNYAGKYKVGEIYPGDTAPAIIEQGGKIIAVPACFGFPGFKDSRLLINARSETAAQKKTFAESMRDRRIVLPANGFFEWSHDTQKSKYLFTVEDRPTIYLCGIYKLVDDKIHFVILTRQANESMIEIHDRMPVMVNESEVRQYLTDLKFAENAMTAIAPELLRQPA